MPTYTYYSGNSNNVMVEMLQRYNKYVICRWRQYFLLGQLIIEEEDKLSERQTLLQTLNVIAILETLL